ncbi:MAG: hypothetical protein EZS28_052864, partial [Streblomastix strix]
CHL